jgi:hypothetical protein
MADPNSNIMWAHYCKLDAALAHIPELQDEILSPIEMVSILPEIPEEAKAIILDAMAEFLELHSS